MGRQAMAHAGKTRTQRGEIVFGEKNHMLGDFSAGNKRMRACQCTKYTKIDKQQRLREHKLYSYFENTNTGSLVYTYAP
jgi:hypothetical protein